MDKIEKKTLCNIEGLEMGTGETEFTPACLDCVKNPSRINKCLENIEKELGIKCCGLCHYWCQPKPTENEKLIGICAKDPQFGISCCCEGCEEFEKRDPYELDEESFDLSDLESLQHTPEFNNE